MRERVVTDAYTEGTPSLFYGGFRRPSHVQTLRGKRRPSPPFYDKDRRAARPNALPASPVRQMSIAFFDDIHYNV